MQETYDEIAAKALELPKLMRVKLAQQLCRSMDERPEDPENVEALWFEVAEKRLEELKNSPDKGRDAFEALADARKNLGA